ncbi:intraflagellar transport protein 80 homolog isoform X2 [Pseudomyrmex gracilis]|uniref:intraflagellar transport protein 80 homolog isoform X2 n=1 Tax=Pseudomyrmex gracilis TaxID=219809 RepID=UPI0009949ED5|nr:intraflagellar transport protein 80 homolog isoform X2 [Pseudomyrmex gracilis]
MRFKISIQGSEEHKRLFTCVAWSSTEEIYSCGEDHVLLCWYLEGGTTAHSAVITVFPDDFYPTDMQWHSRSSTDTASIAKKSSMDVLLITTADGKFHLVNKTGRVEKSVDAHKGATTSGKWSSDGSALLTSGEDGLIKIWSRSGMLRSTLVKANLPILTSSWSPDCSTVLYSQGASLILQHINPSSKPYRWHAHDNLILVACWSQTNGLIVSGGEDCRYKIWDAKGNQLYNSSVGDYPITAISWCYSGACFAVGSFNTLKLCDKHGWSHSLEKITAGSIYSIAWSNDSMQIAMACSNGKLVIGHIIDRRLQWDNYEAILIKRKVIEVREIGNEVCEILEISDRVVHFEFGFDHLVIITPTQCHVYSVTNWNTPVIFNLKRSVISAVLLAEKHFLIVEWNTISLYSYHGRLLGVPKWKGFSQEPLYPPGISLCTDTLIIRDQSNEKLIHVLELSYNKSIVEGQSHLHPHNVTKVAINYIGDIKDRQMALVDVNKDLYLVLIRTTGFGKVCKIATMTYSIAWATDANVLAAMLDANLSVWLCPNCVYYSDRKLIRRTRIDKESSEFGKQPSIVSVRNGIVMVRRGDGAVVASSFYNLFTRLHEHISNKGLKEALSLCRVAQNETLWTCMAVIATDNRDLHVAEEAYAAINRYDKNLPNTTERNAEMALLAGDLLAAEGLLLQNGLIKEAIRINIEVYNWNRALELTIRHKKYLQEILQARTKYLRNIDKNEINQSFLTLMAHTSQPKHLENNENKIQNIEEQVNIEQDQSASLGHEKET